MLTKTQIGIGVAVGAVTWDVRQYAKVKRRYEKLLKKCIKYQNEIASLQRANKVQRDLIAYIDTILIANNIEISEFDKIALMEIMTIDED
jgi:hypothetical protein